MNKSVFITVRTSSSRLKNKALLEITQPKPDPDMIRGIGNPYLVNRAINRGKKYE